MSDSILCRTMTRKSVLGFGYSSYRDLTVQMMLDSKRNKVLVSAYYGLDKINYTDDVLDELCITKDLRIDKPGKVSLEQLPDMIGKVMYKFYGQMSKLERIKAYNASKSIKKEHNKRKDLGTKKFDGKEYLRAKNQGKLK